MERYDYEFAVQNDVRQYIEDEVNREDWTDNREGLEKELNDTLFTHDSVTGNGSGSYTFNAWTADEYVCHNLDLLGEALSEFGCGPEYLMEHGTEEADVTIRCYLLPQCIAAVLDDLEAEGYFDEEEETEQ